MAAKREPGGRLRFPCRREREGGHVGSKKAWAPTTQLPPPPLTDREKQPVREVAELRRAARWREGAVTSLSLNILPPHHICIAGFVGERFLVVSTCFGKVLNFIFKPHPALKRMNLNDFTKIN